MRNVGWAIECMVLCGNRCVVVKRGHEVVRIPLRLHCGRIGQAVEKSPNNYQAQQACGDLEFHRPKRNKNILPCSLDVRNAGKDSS